MSIDTGVMPAPFSVARSRVRREPHKAGLCFAHGRPSMSAQAVNHSWLSSSRRRTVTPKLA